MRLKRNVRALRENRNRGEKAMERKKANTIAGIAITAMIVYGTFSLIDSLDQLNEAKAKNELLKCEIAALKEENRDLHSLISDFDSDYAKAELARERLGLVMPGEIVFTNRPLQTDDEAKNN